LVFQPMVIKYKKALFIAAGLGLLLASAALAQTTGQNAYARLLRAGSEQMKSGDYQGARDSYAEALRYNDSDPAVHLGLGTAYFQLRDDNAAERELTKAAELNPGESTAYQFLGEIYYRKNDLETAASYWEKAVGLNPSSGSLRARLERIRKEHKTEKDFNRDVTGHFSTTYEGREKIEAGKIVLRILEDAYGEVGRALSYYPDREVQVVLYSSQQFQNVTDAPGWSGGIYDGKIRIPIGGIEDETPELRRLLYHEYTHAVVRAITPRCPTWLNEGLAQYFEGREIDARQGELLRRLARAGKLPSLAQLEGPFTGLGGNEAALSYLFSLSAVRYVIDSFGLYRVRSALDELAAGADTGKAISDGIQLSYEDLVRGWKRSLE
jgi:tetratricopeptide (TPR) repeat protein